MNIGRLRNKARLFLSSLVIATALTGPTCKSENKTISSDDVGPVVFDKPSPSLILDLSNENFDWLSINTRHFRIYYERDSYASAHIRYLIEATEESVQRALSIIERPSYNDGIILLVVSSRAEMNDLIGMSVKGISIIGTNLVYMVYNENVRPYLRHEIMHKVSISLLGEPPAWIREGSGMYADGSCLDYENPFDIIAAFLMNRNMLIPLEDFVNNFEKYAGENDLIAYLQAASLFKYIYENYGWKKMEELWNNEPDEFPDILGKSYLQTEKGWRSYLKGVDIGEVDLDWNELMEKGCG